ncbi:MAG: AAA family ATPase [Alphaproteobacteria bacterium]
MRLPIGYSDFKQVIDEKFDFVDKTLLIPEIIDGPQVVLITRPRRFGKTLNMLMLRYFFAETVRGQSTKGLFDNLKVMQSGEAVLKHQGQYPVIFLSFKDIKASSFEEVYQKIYDTITEMYGEFAYLQDSPSLSKQQKDFFISVLEQEASQAQLERSLKVLTDYLFQHHGVKPIVLIDEYDTPIQSGFFGGYYNEAIGFFRGFFGVALKDNLSLSKAVMTGILRVSRESLFSGLNNISAHSILHSKFSSFFGFTQDEIDQLLLRADLQDKASDIKHWYNGYQIGDSVLYNPWSIVNCIQNEGALQPFWTNTSDNILLKDLLRKSSADFKAEFETLLGGTPVERVVDENFVFPDLEGNRASALWSLILMTGYLTVHGCEYTHNGPLCKLTIPNQEIRDLYQSTIEQWLANGYGPEWYNKFINHLLNGEMEDFTQGLRKIMDHTVSYHDIASEPEPFYHGMMIGLTASLADHRDYELRSNRESGRGRYDYLIIARDPAKLSILLEFKQVKKGASETLEQSAQEALTQIDTQGYVGELKQRGLSKILKLGIAFSGKRFGLVHERDISTT